MIEPSLQPGPVTAQCESRRRWSFGLTPRTIGLLIVGFFWLIPGFWDDRLSYAMLGWDALVLLAALLDGMRLPRPDELKAGRSWTNAPALDSETEIELTLENSSRVIVTCRIEDDLATALVAEPATLRVTAFPRVTATVRYRIEPTERGDCDARSLYVVYRSPLGLAERWARAPLNQRVRVYPALRAGEEQRIFLARSRQIDLQLRLARQRGLGRDFESLREYLLDGDCATRQPDYAPVPDGTQPACVDRARLRALDAIACGGGGEGQRGPSCRGCRNSRSFQAGFCLHNGGVAGTTGVVLRRSRGLAGVWARHPATFAAGARGGAFAAIDRGAGAGACRNE
jgi:hypothetical protein